MIRAVTCACRDSLAEVMRMHSGLQVAHCRACGLYARRDAPAPRALALFYEREYNRRFAAEQSGMRDNLQAHALRRIESRLSSHDHLSDGRPGTKGHLIDVGCGNGRLLELAKQAGWTVMGLDPSADTDGKHQVGGIDFAALEIDLVGWRKPDWASLIGGLDRAGREPCKAGRVAVGGA